MCFEVDPAKVAGLPVLGVDPVADYRPLMAVVGLHVEAHEETPGRAERVHPSPGRLLTCERKADR